MRDYTWLDMMKIMQEIRLFSTLHVRRAKKEGITSAQEIDLLSRIVLSDHALTPQDLTVQMGLYKSAVSRLIDHLEKKGFLKKHYCETDKCAFDYRDWKYGTGLHLSLLSGANLQTERSTRRRIFRIINHTDSDSK